MKIPREENWVRFSCSNSALHNVKSTVKSSSIFVAFLENMNFKKETEAIQNSGNQGDQKQQQSNDLANDGSDASGSIISNFGDLAKSGIDSLGDHLGFDLEGQNLGSLRTTIDLGSIKAGDLANAGYEAVIAGINRGTQTVNNLTHALPVVILDWITV